MSVPRAGLVQVQGLLEGPSAHWAPTAEQVAGALQRAGAPADLLQVLVDGGRTVVEPQPHFYPHVQFAGAPAEVLQLALRFLLEEGPGGRPAEWFSTLRLTAYETGRKQEVLFHLAPEGIQVVRRESPWTPAAPSWWSSWRRRWPFAALVLVAAALGAWLSRDQLRALWWRLGAAAGLAQVEADQMPLDASTLQPWVQARIEALSARGVEVLLEPSPSYPRTAAEIDTLRAGAPLEQRAAISAMELGRAQLRVELADGSVETVAVDLAPLRRGATGRAVWERRGSGPPPRRLWLEP